MLLAVERSPKPSPPKGHRKRKRGGQLDHPSHERASFPPEKVDKSCAHKLERCPDCDRQVKCANKPPHVAQQMGLVEKPAAIHECRSLAYEHRALGRVHYAQMPNDMGKGCLRRSWRLCKLHGRRAPMRSLAILLAVSTAYGCQSRAGGRGRTSPERARDTQNAFGASQMALLLMRGYNETQASYSQRLRLPLRRRIPLDDRVSIDLALIPAGSFVMGSVPPEGPTDEEELRWQQLLEDETPTTRAYYLGNSRPGHLVVISRPFYMGVHEVTEGQYSAILGRKLEGGRPNTPEGAVWKRRLEAEGFFETLSNMTGQSFRLPTEAEWEYACRAGTSTTYSCGDDEGSLDEYAWTWRNSRGEVKEVGLKRPNAWGLFDMHGHVFELVSDGYSPYGPDPSIDPSGPEAPAKAGNLYRGGFLMDSHLGLRCSDRLPAVPMNTGYLGFRVLMEVDDSLLAKATVHLQSDESAPPNDDAGSSQVVGRRTGPSGDTTLDHEKDIERDPASDEADGE